MRCRNRLRASPPMTFPPIAWSSVSKLSPAAMERLLRSPALCQALRTNKPRAVARMVEAEIVFERCADEKIDLWSSLGNIWLGELPAPVDHPSMSRDRFGRPAAPCVDGRIPLDLSLAPIPKYPSASLDRPDSVDAAPSVAALQKLDEAMELVRAVSQQTCAVVERMTSNLVLRTDHSTPGRIRSATSAAAIGRTVLVNVEHPSVGVPDVMEALVHEAIHSLTSCAELTHPLMPHDANPVCLHRSPWTAAELHAHAFLHACLVWFGLLNFWLAAERHRALQRHARRRISHIRTGFAKFNLSDCREIAPQPATVELLQTVKERALR